MIELLKTLAPFITFFLGLASVPFVEYRKEKAKERRISESVDIEIQDEYESIIKAIRDIEKSIEKRWLQDIKFQHLSLPMHLDLRLLHSNIEIIYPLKNKDTRKALKTLLLLQGSIKRNYDDVVENWKVNNRKCLAIESVMLSQMLSAYYLLNELIIKKENFTYPPLSNNEIIELAAKSLNVKSNIRIK